jgi:S-DNA-T family DNA segregation ATPase FtsK/SpoIIIE
MKIERPTPSPARNEQPASPVPPVTTPALLDGTMRFIIRFRRFAWDVGGILLLAFALMTLLALAAPKLAGGFLLDWAVFWRKWLGLGSVLVVITASIAGLVMLFRRSGVVKPRVRWGRVFALEIAAFAAVALLSVIGKANLYSAERGEDGGRIGWGLAELARSVLSPLGLGGLAGRGIVLAVILILGVYYGLGLAHPLGMRLRRWLGTPSQILALGEPAVVVAPTSEAAALAAQVNPGKGKKPGADRHHIPPEFRKKLPSQPAEKKSMAPLPPRDDRLPPLDLLVTDSASRTDERTINETAGLIEKSLAEFGIPAKVVGYKVGPSVTQFAIEPGFIEKPGVTEEEKVKLMKVRVAQIAGLHRDLTLALSAERLRIEAPVPGRPYLGIEVPNARSTIVRLRSILESEGFYKVNSPLAIALGRDVSGQPVVADLERMPHLLIAGTTGSGKSVCIAALTTCLVMNNTPEDLRLVMIDPKMVELVRFNGLPHLYGKVETDIQRILGVLHWVVVEMDRRYKLLEAMHARNLEAYNRKAHRRRGTEMLPRIVVMIDELADLMMSAPEQAEPMLVRLAQMARATGIHLVIATQRPSTDVITGLIKANFPARLSFAVASSVDSRVILDTVGAETLLGHGDMLFMPPEISSPLRSQGVMVNDAEVEKVITFWQQVHPPETTPPPWEQLLAEEAVTADRDDLVTKAIDYVRQSQRCSASLLQRHFRIGYPRAARLVDELEELGVIGPGQGGGRERDVLVERDEGDEENEQG